MATKTYKAKSVRISVQDVQKELNASPKWFTIPAASCNVIASESAETIDIINGGGEPNATFLNGIDDISGSINFNIQYPLLAFLFGVSIGEATAVNTTSTDWTDATVVAVGQVVNGTTPATDDLVVYAVGGTGTTGATAPDTSTLTDRELVIDNEVEWAVRKGDLQEWDGSLDPCLQFFAIEVEVEADCAVETVYFRKIGCRVGTLGLSFDKNTGILQADMAVIGTIAQTNIKADGTLDTSYEDFSSISGSTELEIEEEVFVKKGDLDFTLDGNPSEYVESFAITIDNVQEAKNLLSKQNGENQKTIYSTGSKSISGTMSAMFDLEIQGSMDGITTKEAIISADSGFGDKFSLKLPAIKNDKSEPDLSTSTLMLSPNWAAQPVSGESALQYSVTALNGTYK